MASDEKIDPREPDARGVAQATDFEKGTGGLSGVSDLFGLKSSRGDTEKPTGQTGIFTPSGEAPTALFTPLPDDATPRTLQGRYRLVAQLGLGGMGVTYRAWDSKEGVPVVIKMPRKDVRNNHEIMDRFNREVRTMLELSHEHIVPITDHGEEEGCPFVSMRFLPGGSLSEYRGKDEAGKAATLSPATLHFWLPGIARALDFMHSSGVLHRDVKPGNIFLDGFLKPFLGDFGIAKVVDDSAGLNREYTLTATRMAVGTPEYMAPELFRPATAPDGRVDQYALAVTVYEMLAGRKPFRGDSAHIIVEHASKEAPPLQDFCPDVPRRFAEAVHKALSKNPDERFSTCADFAEVLISQAPSLKIDTSRARLLCPHCRAILRVPATSAGKGGTCPKCKSPVAVADDLGSLWLGGEDRLTVSVTSESDPEFAVEEVAAGKATAGARGTVAPPPAPNKGTRRATHWGAFGVVAVGSLLASGFWFNARQHAKEILKLQSDSIGSKKLLRDAEGQISDLEQRVRDHENVIAELEKVKAERESLTSENKRLTKDLAAARVAGDAARPAGAVAKAGAKTASDTAGASAVYQSLATVKQCPGREALLKQIAEAEERGKRYGDFVIVVGRVVLDGPEDPRYVNSQMEILEEGYFATAAKDLTKPIGFRMHKYAPLNLELIGRTGPVFDVGTLTMNRIADPQLSSLSGKLMLEGNGDCSAAMVTLSPTHGPTNTPSGGTSPRPRWPDPLKARVSADGTITATGFAPIEYYCSLKAPGYVDQWRYLTFKPGVPLVLDQVTLERPRKIAITYILSDSQAFDPVLKRRVTINGGERWKATSDIYGYDLQFSQSRGEVRMNYSYGPCTVEDLGEGVVEDFIKAAKRITPKGSPNGEVVRSKHCFLVHQAHWKRWILFGVEIE